MKIALVHDYIKEYGGAERVLEAIHEMWPNAPIFTTVYLPNFLGPHKERFKNWNIRTSFLQYLPFKSKLISPIRLIAPWVFEQFDFGKFDVVIVSATGAYVKQFKVQSSKFKVIVYCHTPPRYLYGYATAREWKNNLALRILGEIANHFLRLIDFKSSQNVDYFIANSINIRKRIEKFYRKDSTVIYPPVTTNSKFKMQSSKLQFKIQNKEYFLAGGRITKAKHIDLIIEAFEKLNLPLKVFGRGFAGNNIESKRPNIEFLGEVRDQGKMELMKNAKAFVIAAEDEDFGITPVEAMSMGTPVIAYKSGGLVESVIDGKTGLFFNELSIDSLSKAIRQFDNLKINPADCVDQAQKFSKERFKSEILEFVNSKI